MANTEAPATFPMRQGVYDGRVGGPENKDPINFSEIRRNIPHYKQQVVIFARMKELQSFIKSAEGSSDKTVFGFPEMTVEKAREQLVKVGDSAVTDIEYAPLKKGITIGSLHSKVLSEIQGKEDSKEEALPKRASAVSYIITRSIKAESGLKGKEQEMEKLLRKYGPTSLTRMVLQIATDNPVEEMSTLLDFSEKNLHSSSSETQRKVEYTIKETPDVFREPWADNVKNAVNFDWTKFISGLHMRDISRGKGDRTIVDIDQKLFGLSNFFGLDQSKKIPVTKYYNGTDLTYKIDTPTRSILIVKQSGQSYLVKLAAHESGEYDPKNINYAERELAISMDEAKDYNGPVN